VLSNDGVVERCGAVDWSEIRLDIQAEDARGAADRVTGELRDGA
jgi:hypothetical protein